MSLCMLIPQFSLGIPRVPLLRWCAQDLFKRVAQQINRLIVNLLCAMAAQ